MVRFAIVQAAVVVNVDHIATHEARDGHGVEVISKKRQVIVEHAHVKQVGRKAPACPIVEREEMIELDALIALEHFVVDGRNGPATL